MTGKVLTPEASKRLRRYNELDSRMKADNAVIMAKTASYWAAAYEIYADRLWEATGNYREQDEWVEEMSKQKHGPSAAHFYSVMRFVDGSLQNGLNLDEVLFAIGTGTTAIHYDVPSQFFKRVGRRRYELSPEIQEVLQREGSSLRDKVMEISTQSASDGRLTVSDTKGNRRVFCTDRAWRGKTLLVSVVETGGTEATVSHDLRVTVPARSPHLDSWLERKFDPIAG